MVRGWSLEYDRTLHRCLLRPSRWPYCFLLRLLSLSSRYLCRCCFLLQTLHYLMSHWILRGQESDRGLRSPVTGFRLHPEKMEVTHKRSQLHIYRWSMIGFVLLNSRSLSQQYLSSGLGLVVN